MSLLIRWILVIPLALLLAIGAAGMFLMIAVVVSPEVGLLVFGALRALSEAMFGVALDGGDPTPIAAAAGWRGLQLGLSVLVLPALLTALASELLRQPSALVQMGLSGVLAAALPAAVMGLARLPGAAETRVLAAFFLTGVVAGGVYWLIAGRGAAPSTPARAVSGPPASTGS
jgi:hypothetical protein